MPQPANNSQKVLGKDRGVVDLSIFGQSIKAKTHKKTRFATGIKDINENQPENPALVRILLINITGTIVIKSMISGIPKSNISATFQT
ncbi:MAG: hypothetical protein GY874_15030 [Desulfobacteraceae bacterium]|nr:hypothetical protein [Desulfobacteraceae bacterium]